MLARTLTLAAAVSAAALMAGCADTPSLFNSGSSNLTTSSVAPAPAKADPVCVSLSSQIDGLRKEGIADKIEKASLKKYKLTTAELAKADQLNKANLDFQSKCSTYKPSMAAAPAAGTPAVASASGAASDAASKAATDAASKAVTTAAANVAKQ